MSDPLYGQSWYVDTTVAAPERGQLVYDLDVDVCVVGAGLAGLTTARELARRGWSVAVLEANRVAWNASSRNAGFVAPGFAERLERIIERVGFERTRALWVLSAAGVDYVRTTISETQMPGVSPVEGWLAVQRIDNQARVLSQADLIGNKLGTEVEAWPTERVREVLKSPVYFQGLHLPGGFHIHPLNYALGLAAAAEQAGAKIFEQTQVLAIDPAGVRKRVTTPSARVRAGHVVLAGSVHLNPLCPIVSGSILPVASHVAMTAPLGDWVRDAITYRGSVVDTRRVGDYYRVVDGNRLMWGGRVATRLTSARRFASLVRRDILSVYPQLDEVEITHAWSGVMGYAVHKMPQIGEVSPGLWVATAFGGHGLNTSAMAGELIASAIAEADDRWRLFSSYDLVYAGGAIGQAVAQALYWFMRARDTVDEQVARQRDAARRRAEALATRMAEEARHRIAAEAARLAAQDAERRAAAQAERVAALRAMECAAEESAEAAVEDVRDRAAEEAASRATAPVGVRRREPGRLAARQAERGARHDAARLALEPVTREAAQRAGRIAAQEAAHRIAHEAARQAGPERRAGDDVTPITAEQVPLQSDGAGAREVLSEPPRRPTGGGRSRPRRKGGRATSPAESEFAQARQSED